ncbi:hypothetical protein C0Q70_06698 [Pomacea canaliculata]|uniref:Uncharacterized protein n=1 Tax=Pomacea canaliculata TaxID=400727 RepID=A0A2T7PCY8_POMCA|nr:hypothetical protein C0Q70_06698 [Pomacea canaliculata]
MRHVLMVVAVLVVLCQLTAAAATRDDTLVTRVTVSISGADDCLVCQQLYYADNRFSIKCSHRCLWTDPGQSLVAADIDAEGEGGLLHSLKKRAVFQRPRPGRSSATYATTTTAAEMGPKTRTYSGVRDSYYRH